MGKGDKKSKKGKRFKASFGNSRKRTAIVNREKKAAAALKPAVASVETAEEKPKTAAKRAPRKKAESAE